MPDRIAAIFDDRAEVLERIIRQLGVDDLRQRVTRGAGNDNGVAIGRGLRHEVAAEAPVAPALLSITTG